VLNVLELRQQTQHDDLTGLLTRGAILALAAQELSRRDRHGRPAALLMLDVDRFRGINDRLGHPGADALLRRIATCAAGALRTGDQIARVGGDEFMILLPETVPPEATVVAEQVRRRVSELSHPQMSAGDVTISIGVAPLRDCITTVDACSVTADQLLYAAKGAGRNRCQQNLARRSLAA